MSHKLANFLLPTPENEFRPPILSYRAFLIYAAILLILRIALGTLPASGSNVGSDTLMKLINDERENRNLTVLTTDNRLFTASSGKAADMIERDYFSHQDPEGNYVWNRIVDSGYTPYKILGENLALDFVTSEGMIKAWLDSPTHRANLLHQDFLDQGLTALYGDYDGRYTNVTVSLFGTLLTVQKPTVNTPPSTQETPPQPVVESETTPPAVPQEEQTPPSSEPENVQIPPVLPADTQNQNTETPETMNNSTGTSPLLTEQFDHTNSSSNRGLLMSRVIFTIFGIFFLIILLIDSVIILKHELVTGRSHSSYHLLTMFLLVLISILIWWW